MGVFACNDLVAVPIVGAIEVVTRDQLVLTAALVKPPARLGGDLGHQAALLDGRLGRAYKQRRVLAQTNQFAALDGLLDQVG